MLAADGRVRYYRVESSARPYPVESGASELGAVYEEKAFFGGFEDVAQHFGLVLVVGGGGLRVEADRRDERLGDVVARELFERRGPED